jgi:hypothetical protein
MLVFSIVLMLNQIIHSYVQDNHRFLFLVTYKKFSVFLNTHFSALFVFSSNSLPYDELIFLIGPLSRDFRSYTRVKAFFHIPVDSNSTLKSAVSMTPLTNKFFCELTHIF